jgi:AraC-like DNA-binding protein
MLAEASQEHMPAGPRGPEGGASPPRFGSEARRRTLHRSGLVHAEDGYIPSEGPFPSGYETRYQISLPYFGLFSYSVGRRHWTIDANRSLFISPGWESREAHPLVGTGHAAIILTPSTELLDEIIGRRGPERSSAFMSGSLPASMRVKLLAQHLLRLADHPHDPLEGDEWTVRLMRESIMIATRRTADGSKVVERAKELLHAHCGERLSLEHIARAVGVSPVYLTQEFTRQEGIPLYRYQLRLRLTQALLELPHCDDITGLALDLGFSSHSHFTAAFRNMFGLTPSEYRASVGTRRFGLSAAARAEAFRRHAA